MLMPCPFAVLFPSPVRVRPEVSAADHDAAVANPRPGKTKDEPMTANDHLRLKFVGFPPKKEKETVIQTHWDICVSIWFKKIQ